MPGIPKGAKLTDAQKKKVEKMKKDGATKSELSRVRMAMLRGHSFAKAKKMSSLERRDEKNAVKKMTGKTKNNRTTKSEEMPEEYSEGDM